MKRTLGEVKMGISHSSLSVDFLGKVKSMTASLIDIINNAEISNTFDETSKKEFEFLKRKAIERYEEAELWAEKMAKL